MKKIALRIALCLILLGPVFGQTVDPKESPSSPKDRMDKLFDFWNRQDQPGFAVVVVKDGRIAYQNVFGLACQEHGVAIAPKTVFNLAEGSQPFVGLAVALLEKQGKLSLDDDVRKYIPEIPDFGVPLKIRHLLFQTSGLRDWLSILQLAGRDKDEVAFDQVLKTVKAQARPLFAPGDRFQDSNTNYDLLAETIRRATGKPFSEWAWENIFKPLKMTRTQFRDNARSIFDDQAFSYNFTRQEYLRGIDNLSLAGSHSLFASLADLAKWMLDFETGALGGREIIDKTFAAGRLNNGQSAGFGYGWNVGTDRGRRRVSRSGTWAGSGTVLVYYPDQKFGFVVLANWDYTSVEGFPSEITDIYLPLPAAPAKPSPAPSAAKPVKVSPAILDSYAGEYRFAPGQIFTINRKGEQLVLGVRGATYALTALSNTEFLLALADARISFLVDKDGTGRRFLWSQGGVEQVAPKVVLVKPTASELQEFSGAYSNAESNLRYVVEVRGDRLILNGPGQSNIGLAPDEKDRFITASRMMPMVIFQRDGQNRVTGFVIGYDSLRDLVFKKD